MAEKKGIALKKGKKLTGAKTLSAHTPLRGGGLNQLTSLRTMRTLRSVK